MLPKAQILKSSKHKGLNPSTNISDPGHLYIHASRVDRFLLVQHTQNGKNIPNDHEIHKIY
jgi:hypothetical protein